MAAQRPFPAFDPGYYRARHAGLALETDAAASLHYAETGRAEGLVASPLAEREAIIDIARTHGSVLEIGPFCNPLLTGESVEYLDVLDADGLRRRAAQHKLDASGCPPVIHYVGSLEQVDRRFDAVISSHSVEHQPDLVRHLEQVARVLDEGGRYYLIIPDKRFCFDHYLPESSIADVLAAYREARQVHSLKSVIEHAALVTHNDAARHWRGDHGPQRDADFADRIGRALKDHDDADGGYIDVHAWQFTPASFRVVIETLRDLHLTAFDIEEIYDTPRDRQEFCAILTKHRAERLTPLPHHDAEVLFLQTADAFRYAPMLAVTSITVTEYCRRHGFAYESFVGLKRGAWNWQATYNRIAQYKELLDRGFTGWAIYLDADAYIQDLDFDLPRYLADKGDRGAIFATSGVTGEHWDVNAGVAFINLGHEQGRQLVESWWQSFAQLSDERLEEAREWLDAGNDQDLLHQILRHDREVAGATLVESMDFINSMHARFIRQHLRAQADNFETRLRNIVDHIRAVLLYDGSPSSMAASEMLPGDPRGQAQLLHPLMRPCRLIERPVPAPRADLAHKAIEAWRSAGVHPVPPSFQTAFAAALAAGDEESVAVELAQLGRAELAQGFFGGKRQHLRIARDAVFGRQRAQKTYDALVSLAEMVGALPLEDPDVGGWGQNALLKPADLFAMIEEHLGVDLTPAPHVGGYLGIEVGRGIVLHLRMVEAIYTAWRLREWTTLVGGDRVLELGGGAGWTAFYARRLGLNAWRLLDRPEMNAVQAYLLGETPGALPPLSLDRIGEIAPGSIDIVVNEDTLAGTDAETAHRFLTQAAGLGARAMLNLNREASGDEPRPAAGKLIADAGFRLAHRQRHGLRAGFAEELFLAPRR
ncbi:class I SAM-dependent methyltransferase [Sphingomonas sp. PR090111-T3T-6A]|uniref:class I SAM-dependent methyltransferase n=1 Tax=Sphingomonas sp. PR090111-T3T-6A TaxID=685778 RepID=UPI000362B8BC|nr:methyltransferase domain-containing protein [Sphingomonas sp. PR090111-T3T-6A]